MIQKAGKQGVFKPVGKANDTHSYPVIGADDVAIAFSCHAQSAQIGSGRGYRGGFDKISS